MALSSNSYSPGPGVIRPFLISKHYNLMKLTYVEKLMVLRVRDGKGGKVPLSRSVSVLRAEKIRVAPVEAHIGGSVVLRVVKNLHSLLNIASLFTIFNNSTLPSCTLHMALRIGTCLACARPSRPPCRRPTFGCTDLALGST